MAPSIISLPSTSIARQMGNLPGVRSLVHLLSWRAQTQPNDVAYIVLSDGENETARITYEQLDQQARTISAHLRHELQLVPGDRALLLYPPGIEYLSAFFGCLYAGIIAIPAYPPHFSRIERSLPKLRAIADSARFAAVLTIAELLHRIRECCATEPLFQDVRWTATDSLSSTIAALWTDPGVTEDSLAFLQYTSGSTATPKGVMVSHGNLLTNHQMIQAAFQHPPGAAYVSWLPLFHDMGLIGNALQAIYVGVPCVMMPPMAFLQKPIRWLQAITRYRAHTSGGPNFAYELCVQKTTPEQRKNLDLSSWQLAFNGAEMVRHSTLERFAATFAPYGLDPAALYPCYGLAEATLFVAGGRKGAHPAVAWLDSAALERGQALPATPQDSQKRAVVSCGYTWLEQQIVIADPDTGQSCPPGTVGEIWVAGPNIAQGYWNRPLESEHVFDARLGGSERGPFLRTGDLGFLQAGELFITGRLKDLIIVNGRNLYPHDIEHSAEQSHPALRAGCLAAFSVEVDSTEQVVLLAELERHYRPTTHKGGADPEHDPDAGLVADITRSIRRAVAEQHDIEIHKVVLLAIGGVFKTSSGKVQRRACRAAYLAGELKVWGGPRSADALE